MSEYSTIINVNKKCRICLSNEGSMINIFTSELSEKIQVLSESTSIHINDGVNLPRKICHVCLYKLELWCEFKNQFIHTSNILLKHLKDTNTNDNSVKGSFKRRYSDTYEYLYDNINDNDVKKKFKSDTETLTKSIKSSNNKNTISLSPIITHKKNDCDKIKQSLSIDNNVQKYELDTTSGAADDCQLSVSSMTKIRTSSGRRTSEQRMASTQRWEARKKALLAATGENDTDSDSMASDKVKLSPIQLSRSKNYNYDMDIDRLRHLNKTINNLTKNDSNINIDNDIKFNLSDDNSMNSVNDNDTLKSNIMQSELIIGDATFIVTSKLLSQSHNVNDKSIKNNDIKIIDDKHEKNTDIIDAVKLRRVNNPSNDNNYIERCLNIEVEGNDLLSLKRIQIHLDNYLMNDMKNKLLNNNITMINELFNDKIDKLEEKLKLIVEKSIRKNLDMTKLRRVPISKIASSNMSGNKIFSSAFIKAAMKSQLFQPKVVLNRIKPTINNQLIPINNKYNDNKNNIIDITIINDNNVTMKNNIIDINSGTYSCNICNELFSTKNDIELHLNNHKKPINAKTPINIISKRKMMRCKRCHEIVESRYVKSHICEWKKSLYHCSSCSVSFKNEQLLMRHIKAHKEMKIDGLIGLSLDDNEIKQVKAGQQPMIDEVKIERIENIQRVNDTVTNNINDNNIINKYKNIVTYTCFVCDKNFNDDELLKDHLQMHCDDISDDDSNKNTELYQCAICGETLNDEKALGYHVENHLFDNIKLNNDNNINDNYNGINNKLNSDNDCVKYNLYKCIQCNEEFNCEINLALHVQGHDEELAIAEWEKSRLIKLNCNYNVYICTICDDKFDNEHQLALHIDIHNDSKHICILCDKPFLTLDELRNHVDTH